MYVGQQFSRSLCAKAGMANLFNSRNIVQMFHLILDQCISSQITANYSSPFFMTIVIVPLLSPTLFDKMGIFTRSPLLWVLKTLSFLCYHVHLPRLSY